MKIIEIEERHLDDIAQLYEELSGEPTDTTKMAEIFYEMQKDKKYKLLGVEENGKVIGTAMGILCYDLSVNCDPFMVIENVVVAKTGRRNGAGKMLIEKLERIAKEAKCYYIILVSASHRKEAHLFYEKLGYSMEIAKGFKKYL